MKPETMMADGDECYVNHTSALECWLIMHSLFQVDTARFAAETINRIYKFGRF